MAPEMHDIALRLRELFVAKGAPDIVVGVGKTDAEGGRVPALHVYCTDAQIAQIDLPALFDLYEGKPVVWNVGGGAFTAGPATDPAPKVGSETQDKPWMSSTTRGSFILTIDTDAYAGNFERELTAYCTGQIGVCEVGDRERREFLDACGIDTGNAFAAVIEKRGDEYGCYRPCAIWTPPAYKSVAIFFAKRPGPDLIDLIQARAREYAAGVAASRRRFAVLGFRLIYEEVITRQVEEAL